MKIFKLILAIAIVTIVGAAAYAFNPFAEKAEGVVNTLGTDGVAIKGYDPVAYFTAGGPREGKPEFTYEYKGAKWQFASAENKALFEANPDKYEPAYGGFCAFGVAQDALVKIEPDAWSIRNGKLYLNYDRNVQSQWAQKPDEYIQRADKKWPDIIASQ